MISTPKTIGHDCLPFMSRETVNFILNSLPFLSFVKRVPPFFGLLDETTLIAFTYRGIANGHKIG